jgi:hydroxymethylpyrimidine kinase/phosphomethylpyrimidine kinase
MTRRSPRILTIAGSDSGGGAGIQADLKTFTAHGAFGMSAVTALTAQNTVGVRAVHRAPADFVAAQIDAVCEDIPPDAVKVGMLADAAIVAAVADRLRAWSGPPLVVDPVMMAASGDPLLADDAVETLRERLLPLATVVTPNLPEAERLAGRVTSTLAERRALAAELGRQSGAALLLKGGHAPGEEIVDLLWHDGRIEEVAHPRLPTRAGHGTGCALSSAIAVRLGRGEPLVDACRGAIAWLSVALGEAEPIGRGCGPVDILWTVRREGRFA